MRVLFATVLALAVSISAMAANTPTSEQCKSGYKAEYAKTWTKDQFTKACADLKVKK